MRVVVARRRGRRGEGLGNEFFAWSKGWIASQVLDAHLVGPAWGLNARRYYRNFRTSRLDVLLEELLVRLPHHAFTEADYMASGKVDFADAIDVWAASKGLSQGKSFVVTVDGMYGGYPAIRSARSFLTAKLLNSRDALKNAFALNRTLDRKKLFVAVHMRFGGDFSEPAAGDIVRSKFNIRVPDEWYLWVCSRLKETYGDRVQFHFFTDRGGPGFDEAVRRFNPGQTRQIGLTECSDVVMMAQADLRVCSVSSYSLLASFLSGGPYLWYEPQLNLSNGVYSLWSHEPGQRLDGSLSRLGIEYAEQFTGEAALDASRTPLHLGTAIAIGESLPGDLLQALGERLRTLDGRTNLLEFGSLRRS